MIFFEKCKKNSSKKTISCYSSGLNGPRQDILAHAKQCSTKVYVCENCNKFGHSPKVCRERPVKAVQYQTEQEDSVNEQVYSVNIFRVREALMEPKGRSNDFKVQLLINNQLDTLLADTGAGISVCGMATASKWNLLDRMTDTKVKIKPYNSDVISTVGVSTCGVSFGDRTIPVQWYIIKDSCEPILAGKKAEHLGVIKFKNTPGVLMPVNMIEISAMKLKDKLHY